MSLARVLKAQGNEYLYWIIRNVKPVCRFAISMNGAKLKTERSCSTYRKCVEAMRNNTLTCNKRTNGTSCTGCCVGHLCNKNDFIDYSLFQRNLQCQTCSGIICNDAKVTSCPGTEPVCRFAISMNGAKLKTERSCSTYRKCVEAMRNNTLTCNKRTNGTSCTGCCVGHLCNKNDFIGKCYLLSNITLTSLLQIDS
ncbi:Hypothetical predicted protein [Octopus vulgaris]|uniref:Uncharacterized protein n=1 Tax=Octopus vulgaris TaxID=6645 RepID=A0AA36MEY7_OCTVU|nr:Hypothetical predicted protein [Octopus vulgaris]